MGLESKHKYRFEFLKSEKWKSIRLQRLVIDGAMCRVCRRRDLSNDVHHIRYPSKWEDTSVDDIRTLCRDCHEQVHDLMENNPKLSWRELKGQVFSNKGCGKKMAGFLACLKFLKRKVVDRNTTLSVKAKQRQPTA